MISVHLDRFTDRSLDDLYLTLRNAVRSDEYATKPVLLAHASEVLTAVRQERTNRVLGNRYGN